MEEESQVHDNPVDTSDELPLRSVKASGLAETVWRQWEAELA